MVTQILHDNPIDPGLYRFCQPVATDPMVDAATWADDYRATHLDTAAIGISSTFRAALPKAHLTSRSRNELHHSRTRCADQDSATPGSSPADQAIALRFIIHFAGDIHQPLHCTTNNDRGGNCVPGHVLRQEAATRPTRPPKATTTICTELGLAARRANRKRSNVVEDSPIR